MLLKEKTRNRVILFVSILLISIGTFNLSTNIYGQVSVPSDSVEPKALDQFYQFMIDRVISIIVPYAAGLIGILVTYARSKGLQISKDAEEYLIGATQSVVENQSRLLFDKVYKNKELLGAWATNNLDAEGMATLKTELKKYETEVKSDALTLLEKEITSSRFKQTVKDMIGDNLDALIESAYTKNQLNKAERAKNLLLDLSGLAIDSALLYYNKKTLEKSDKEKIIEDGIKILAKNFDFEYIVLDVSNAKMHLEAALSKKIE